MELYRAVVEVRHYAPLYLDTRGRILERFQENYPEFSIEEGLIQLEGHTRLRNVNRGITAFTHGVHTGLEMTFEPFDLRAFATEGEKFCRTVVRDIYKLDAVARVGMRFFHRWEIPGRDLVGFTLQKLLRSIEDFSDLDMMATNWRLGFETQDDERAYNFQFRPEFEEKDGIKRFTGQLIADFDAYQKNLPMTAVTSLRNDILEVYGRILALGTRLLEGIV